MAVQTEVVYPSTGSASGSGQVDLGPFYVPAVTTLLRAEVRGKINFETLSINYPFYEANYQLWALQWVPHGTVAQNCITSADGKQWLIRQQVGSEESRIAWAPTSDTGLYLATYPTVAEWAGQQYIGESIDLYLSMAPPTSAGVDAFNYYGSIRFWWS